MKYAGLDYMSKDITKAQLPQSYAILEINASPGIDMHEYPFEGEVRKVSHFFLQGLFPKMDLSQ
jgi:cyanophycin synthetase